MRRTRSGKSGRRRPVAGIDEHRIYITSAERGEQLSCFAHGTNCGHEHLLAAAEGDDIDSCEWECAGGETAEPDWPDCRLHGCAP